ncbi:hypothetical protein RJ640_023427 [Escallonia rubra]|uniref:Uncharacterized protein n=1 Tax=Escallonia rubra TaxID=112253 RepID=A0AA88R6G9_9ASTE|nr:hypothetical protein RJ640_023427 [Escallonia rubra]
MEDHQKSYMHSFLSRIRPKPNQSAEDATKEIANKMLEKVADALSCYEATDKPYDDARFAEMLLVDGCFILELLYRRNVNYPRDGDPIFGNALVHLDVKHDLLLLENQIPMFVLQTLFDLILGQSQSLPDLIISFFWNTLNVDHELKLKRTVRTQTAAHILGLLHDCYMPCDKFASELQSPNQIIKHSAIDLFRAGVQFTEGKGRDQICVHFSTSYRFSFLRGSNPGGRSDDIPTFCNYVPTKLRSCYNSRLRQFRGRTSFEVPKLCIYDSTERFFRNLIALEQCSPGIRQPTTSYAFLMDILVNTKDDVEVLEKAGVLENDLGASEHAVRLFNVICKNVFLGEFIFSKEWVKVEAFCKLKWPSQPLDAAMPFNCCPDSMDEGNPTYMVSFY